MTLTVLASSVPGAERQRLRRFVHDAPWDAAALDRRRLAVWQARREPAAHAGGVLVVDETGDPKRGHAIALVANQYLGKLGRLANGVVAVTTHWTAGHRHVPLGVEPYRPAARLPEGNGDASFRTEPEPARELIEGARAAGIPSGCAVADCVDGENSKPEARLCTAGLKHILAIRPGHGTWQFVEDEADPPAFTPAEAARRLPRERWGRTVRKDSHGKELVQQVADLSPGSPTARSGRCARSPPPMTRPRSTRTARGTWRRTSPERRPIRRRCTGGTASGTGSSA